MKKNSPFRLERPLRRYCLYQAATRFGFSMLVCLLWDRLANPTNIDLNHFAFFFMAVFFVLLTWLTYLRIDGLRMPQLKMDFLKKIKKKVIRSSYTDMSDYADEEIVSFDDLEDDEKIRVRLYANALCALIYLIISFF